MSLTNSFAIAKSFDNIFLGLFIDINEHLNGWLVYALLIIILIVMNYSFIKKTQDAILSAGRSFFLTTIITIIPYYLGKQIGYVLIPDLLMLTLVVLSIVSLPVIFYTRD